MNDRTCVSPLVSTRQSVGRSPAYPRNPTPPVPYECSEGVDATKRDGVALPQCHTSLPARSSESAGIQVFARKRNVEGQTTGELESTLLEHYNACGFLLTAHPREEGGFPRPSEAGSRLQRLSSTLFDQLRTDILDEMARRQRLSSSGTSIEEVSQPFLLLRSSFHPKRNTARRKLSTLPPGRFDDLAADVLYEQEQRSTQLAEDADDQQAGQAGSFASMKGTPSRVGANADGWARWQMPCSPQQSFEAPADAISQGDCDLTKEGLDNGGTLEIGNSRLMRLDGAPPGWRSVWRAGDLMEQKTIIEGYLSQLTGLREELEGIEHNLKRKRDDLTDALH